MPRQRNFTLLPSIKALVFSGTRSCILDLLVYSVIVIFLCFIIYAKTKELYSLTKHKGIGFFRNTFLYFGLAFSFRLLFTFFHLSRYSMDFYNPLHYVMPFALVIIGYLSTMAIFSLTLSSLWKKIKQTGYMTHIIAVAIAVLVFFTRSTELLIITQLALRHCLMCGL